MNTKDCTSHHVMPTYARQPVAMVRGEGSWIWDEDGNKYLDFSTGIAVCSLGHCHPVMRAAIEAQAAKLWHCSNLYHIPGQAELAAFINDTVMARTGRVFFSNSGAEANDGLIKAARRYGLAHPMADGTPRSLVLTFRQSFHGRTLGGIAATGQDKVKEGFDPMLPGFRHLPFNDIAALTDAMAGGEVAAVMVEVIQGEGGVNVIDKDFLLAMQNLCTEHDALLFFDEVQAGMGRAGAWCAWDVILGDDKAQVRPDGVSWAKGMGGGFPIGSFWLGDRPVTPELPLHSILGPGSHGSTYGGSPLASAVSLAVLKEIEAQNLIRNASERGAELVEAIDALHLPAIKNVRGNGLLLGAVLNTEVVEKLLLPEGPTPAMRVVHACRSQGLLVVPAGPDVIRLLPSLNVSSEEISQAVEILAKVLA